MPVNTLPAPFQRLLETHHAPDALFAALLPALGEALNCDRCFIYLRNPATRMGKVTHCWRRSASYPEILDPDWKPEPASLTDEDPMFAAAVRAEDSIYVEDVESTDSTILNREFERQNFGHRALVHAHLRQHQQLWGILQPCVFDQPRSWSESDRALIATLESQLTPFAMSLVKVANV